MNTHKALWGEFTANVQSTPIKYKVYDNDGLHAPVRLINVYLLVTMEEIYHILPTQITLGRAVGFSLASKRNAEYPQPYL